MKIPRIIHKVIIVDNMKIPEFEPDMTGALNSFREMNPGYQLKIYNGNDCVAYIKKHYDEEKLWAFLKLKVFSYQCDFFRMLVLYNEGGFYSDMRQVCLKSFDECFPGDMEWFSAKDRFDGYMCNSFIASVPGHRWVKETIDRIVLNIRARFYGKNPLYPTGPKLFGNICRVNGDEENCYIGALRDVIVPVLSEDVDSYFFNHENNPFIKMKIDKPDGKKYAGGEWENDNGNNYNHLWMDRDIYHDKKVLKALMKKYDCAYREKYFRDIPLKLPYVAEKIQNFYKRKGHKFVPVFLRRIGRFFVDKIAGLAHVVIKA